MSYSELPSPLVGSDLLKVLWLCSFPPGGEWQQ